MMNQISLLSYVKSKINPSEDQANLLEALEDFINSESKIFLMKGYAGTGKTTITKYLAEYLSAQKKDEHTSKYSL
jgi:adenylylsulfate kinase-like enzyme